MHTPASIPSAVALPLAPLESLHRAVAGLVMLLIVARTGMALRGEILVERFSSLSGSSQTSSLRPASTPQLGEPSRELSV
jgi:hypothetical protein